MAWAGTSMEVDGELMIKMTLKKLYEVHGK